jgi:hypothetical protein
MGLAEKDLFSYRGTHQRLISGHYPLFIHNTPFDILTVNTTSRGDVKVCSSSQATGLMG